MSHFLGVFILVGMQLLAGFACLLSARTWKMDEGARDAACTAGMTAFAFAGITAVVFGIAVVMNAIP